MLLKDSSFNKNQNQTDLIISILTFTMLHALKNRKSSIDIPYIIHYIY